MNAGGKLVVPGDLVVDPDMPDLGIDWAPHPDIPKEALSLLTRQLKIGKPAIEKLIKSHIRAAYDKAVKAEDSARTMELLVYLSKQLRSRSPEDVQKLLPGLLVEDAKGKFRPATELLLPLAGIQDYVKKIWAGEHPRPSETYPEDCRDFLIALGVRTMPSVEQIRDVFDLGVNGIDMSVGLAGLINGLYREGKDLSSLPLKEQPWIADGNDKVRCPDELFERTGKVSSLLGSAPDLYADGDVRSTLDSKFKKELGFKQLEDVRLKDVLGRIKAGLKTGAFVPFQVYKWMEQGLDKGWLNADELVGKLKGKNWVYTDDRMMFPASKVLGTRAVEYFGKRRGYWSRGVKDCPELCALFGIPTEVTDEMVQNFLKEVSRDISKSSDKEVIAEEPAIPRMLLTCAARLGKNGVTVGKNLKVFVSKQCDGKEEGAVRVMAASDVLLFMSETPTLEALFSKAGTFYLVETGRAGEREEIIAFYNAMKIRRLRDSYTAVVDSKSGRDTTSSSGGRLQGLKTVLHALAMVMPRVEKQRDHLEPSGWVYRERLKPLGEAGTIHVIRNLQVRMALEGVGSVSDAMTARFDPQKKILLIEEAVLDDPVAYSPGLAEGLIPCIFEGNGEDDLVEIVELLLNRSSTQAMNNYLDRRHFPKVEMKESAGEQRLMRLANLLNYSFHENLRSHFESLKDCDFDKWRDPRLHEKIAAVPSKNPNSAATEVARLLLHALGVADDEEPLVKVLANTFKADSINGVPMELQQTASQPEPEHNVELGEIDRKPPEAEGPTTSEDDHQTKELLPEKSWDAEPVVAPPPEPEVEPGGGFGLFEKISSWFGQDDSEPAGVSSGSNGVQVPGWATGNNLRPVDEIGSQLGFTGLNDGGGGSASGGATDNAPAGFYYDPCPLPRPHNYGIQKYGTAFNPSSQEWTDDGLPSFDHLEQLSPSAHVVRFRGLLSPGLSQLPVPMYGRMNGKPRALDGKEDRLGPVKRRSDRGYEITVKGGSPVQVEFEIQLQTVPDLDEGPTGTQKLAPELSRPTMAWEDLPGEVQKWIENQRFNNLNDSEQALAVAAFVQSRYCYDKFFNDTPQAKRCRLGLRPGQGNHHLELLHACGDQRYLGRGVCFELNSMVVEILRHLGLPSAVATGWTFEKKNVTDPDHLFAVAFVKSPYGICPLPLEAATGEGGREMEFPEKTGTSSFDIDRGAADVPENSGAWNAPIIDNIPEEVDVKEMITEVRETTSKELRERATILSKAIQLACNNLGKKKPNNLRDLTQSPTPKLVREMRKHLEDLLKDNQMAANLLGLLRGEFRNVHKLPKAIHKLEQLGLAEIETVPHYRVTIANKGTAKRKSSPKKKR